MSIKRRFKKESGFSLVELAVVLIIIGVLLGSFIGTLGSRIDTQRRIETKDALSDIRVALYGFALSQFPVRLPCPDIDNDGLEDVLASGACSVLTMLGNLPWLTLGLERGDAWSSTYSYWVADVYSNTAGFNLASNASGVGQVIDSVGGSGSVLSDNVAAVIFSHGKNQYGSIGIDNNTRVSVPVNTASSNYDDERENLDVDAVAPVTFVSRSVTDGAATVVFDDLLIWISEYELKGNMVRAGVLPN